MNDCLRLRVVLRESDAGRIHEAAFRASEDPANYGQHVTRDQLATWGSPAPDKLKAVLAWLSDLQKSDASIRVDWIAGSPIVFITGPRDRLSSLFKPGTVERLEIQGSVGFQIPAWEFAGKLEELEGSIRTVHAVGCESGKRDDSPARATPFGDPPPPIRGWTFPHLASSKPRMVHHKHPPRSSAGNRLEEGVTPELIRKIYNFPSALKGKGQTIAIMSLGSPDGGNGDPQGFENDLNAFWSAFRVHRTGRTTRVSVGPPAAASDRNPLFRLEATMGPAWIGAVVPEANLVLYELALDLPDPWLAAVEAAVADKKNAPTVLCMTWTWPEEFYYRQYNRSSIALALAKAAALGLTVVVGAGDWGVYDGRPGSSLKGNGNGKVARAAWPHATFPSTEDRVLSVGGTLVSTLEPHTEIGWSGPLPPDPDLARELPFVSLATSGGFSQRVPIPRWQRASVVGSGEQRIYARGSNVPAVLPYGRGYPDVALMAAGPSIARSTPPGLSATGYQLVVDGEWIDYAGGTSLAAPIWASAIAVINERRAAAATIGGQGPAPSPVGFVNPALYYLGRTRPIAGPSAVLRKIESGSSDIEFRVATSDGQTNRHVLAGYRAKGQWDPVTGLGVPNVHQLAEALATYHPDGAHQERCDHRV